MDSGHRVRSNKTVKETRWRKVEDERESKVEELIREKRRVEKERNA